MKIEKTTELREMYGSPSFRAAQKGLPMLEKHAINFIKTSPFVIISTVDQHGKLDASPRGGAPGFIHILNDTQILIPDAKGNNRVDSLSNIVETGQIGMLFLIPGVDETLRLNGKASVSKDSEFLSLFTSEKNPPKACILIDIEEVFLHCAKALMRSKLWDPSIQIERSQFPTMGQMLKDQLNTAEEPETQEAMVERYQKDL